MCEGDCDYKQLNTSNLLAADELSNVVQTADSCMFSVEYVSLENGDVSVYSQEFPFLRCVHDGSVDKGVGFVVLISGFAIGVIPYDRYYLFDSHSRNGQDSKVAQVKAALLKFADLQDMEKYVQVVYLQKENQIMPTFKSSMFT